VPVHSAWFNPEFVVYSGPEPLLTADVAFCSLHRDMTEKELDPFQGRTEFPLMSVSSRLEPTLGQASNLRMLCSGAAASLALGEIPSVPEKVSAQLW
jgi:hypothetical protein